MNMRSLSIPEGPVPFPGRRYVSMRFSVWCSLLLVLLLPLVLPSGLQAQCVSGNCVQGSGVYIYPSGARYIGMFSNGKREGLGTCYYSDGSEYFGYWESDRQDGDGIQTSARGEVLKGVWRKGRLVKEDPSLVIRADGKPGQLESGCTSGDCGNGVGVFVYPDGTVFSGKFINGRRHGYGVCYYPSGTQYKGSWKNDMPNGNGTMTYSDGREQNGFWVDGKYVPPPPQTGSTSVAASSSGCQSGNCMNGFGTFVFKDGSKYTGNFRNGKPEGHGTIYYSNGETYEGMLAEGKLEGRGTYRYPDGRSVEGYWENGIFKGEAGPGGPLSPPGIEPIETVKVWAVVIGVAAYTHMPALRYTDDDAYRIYAFLKSPEGGAVPDEQIRILIDESATRDRILATMRDVFTQAGPSDLVLLYFSGHGVPGAFLPIDYDGLNRKVFHQEISQILTQSPAKYKLCIADACHSGGILAQRGADVQETLVNYYQKLAQSAAGTALIMSSKSDETSLEASGLRQGVFSHFLIRGLKGDADRNDDQAVSIQELFDYVYFKVRDYTRNQQSPVIRGRYDRDMPISVRRGN